MKTKEQKIEKININKSIFVKEYKPTKENPNHIIDFSMQLPPFFLSVSNPTVSKKELMNGAREEFKEILLRLVNQL